jgi:hypothetical protein
VTRRIVTLANIVLLTAEEENYVSRQRQSVGHAVPKQLRICALFNSFSCNVPFGNSGRMAENNNFGKDVERSGRGMF